MDIHKFIELETALVNSALNISRDKRPAYTGNSNDVLKNFKSAAEAAGVTPMQAWAVLAKKHLDALLSFAKDPAIPQAETLWGRASDAINYTVLGIALAVDLGLMTDVTDKRDSASPSETSYCVGSVPRVGGSVQQPHSSKLPVMP